MRRFLAGMVFIQVALAWACSRPTPVSHSDDASAPARVAPSAPPPVPAASPAASAPAPAPLRYPRAPVRPAAGHKVPPSGHALNDAALSRDGTRLATTGLDQVTIVWDVDSWSVVGRLRGSASLPYDRVAFRPDGALLACGPGPYVYVGTIGEGEQGTWKRLLEEPGRCAGLDVVRDSDLAVLTTTLGDIVLFDSATGTVKTRHRLGGWWLGAPALTSGADRVAVIGQALAVVDLAKGTKLHQRAVERNGLANQMAFSPGGDRLAVARYAAGIALLDGTTYELAAELAFPFVGQVVFTPDGSRLIGATSLSGGKGELRWWDTANWTQIHAERVSSSPLRLLMGADGRVVVAVSAGGSVRFFDARRGEPLATADASPW